MRRTASTAALCCLGRQKSYRAARVARDPEMNAVPELSRSSAECGRGYDLCSHIYRAAPPRA